MNLDSRAERLEACADSARAVAELVAEGRMVVRPTKNRRQSVWMTSENPHVEHGEFFIAGNERAGMMLSGLTRINATNVEIGDFGDDTAARRRVDSVTIERQNADWVVIARAQGRQETMRAVDIESAVAGMAHFFYSLRPISNTARDVTGKEKKL